MKYSNISRNSSYQEIENSDQLLKNITINLKFLKFPTITYLLQIETQSKVNEKIIIFKLQI